MNHVYIERLKNIKIGLSDETLSANDKQLLKCLSCSNQWLATPKSKIQNYKKYKTIGCPCCTRLQRYGDTRLNNINSIEHRFEILTKFDIKDFNNNLMLNVKNKKCGHIFVSKTGNLLNRDINCPICNTEVKRNTYRKFNEEKHNNALCRKSGFSRYNLLVNKLTRETYRKHSKLINPHNYVRARSGQDGYHLDHIISKKYCFENEIPAEICAHSDNLRMIYWKDNAEKWKKPQVYFPQIFSKYVKSYDKIKNFVNILNEKFEVECFSTDLIDDTTITIVSHIKKTVIQFLALNENLETNTGTKNYNKELQKKVQNLGYTFIGIFEDEWDKNYKLVLNKIDHLLGENLSPVIMARKCVIREIDNDMKNKFLNKNHIQGTSISQINLGAFYDDALVATMTFCKPRILMNKRIEKNKKSWELARFATDINSRVVGISSKLLSFFKNNYEWDDIYSYADKRWSTGNLYFKLGFTLNKDNPPDYYYILDGKRKHRWGFRKDALREKYPTTFDPTLTEYQNMLNMNIDRVWDCGTLKFIIKRT